MLESSLFESQGVRKTRKPVTVVVSAIVHVVIGAVLVLIPLLETQALTIPPINMALLLPRVERLEAVQVFPAQQRAPQRQQQAPSLASPALTAPQTIPPQIGIVDAPSHLDLPYLPLGTGSSGVPFPIAVLSNRTSEIAVPTAPPPPVPPPPVPAATATPYRTGGKVQAANLIYQVNPVYPAIAKITRTQGVVVLEALINKEGSIDSLRVLSGSPLLAQAAIDAVKQWRYRPTLLNGEPTDVITTITVTFTLQ